MVTADLSAYADEGVLLGFRYWTDGNTVNPGLMVDNLEVADDPIDGAEDDTGWTFDGFIRSMEEYESGPHYNAYVSEFRQYTGYDEVLQTAYNFYWTGSTPYYNWVEHYPYQDGLLINYWDTSVPNNNTGSHPGRGLLLPVDAHPEVLYRAGGQPWRNRVQTYDSTFGLETTDPITLHWRSYSLMHRDYRGVMGGLDPNPLFDDTIQYYREENPLGGVINPNTGTSIMVIGVSDYTEDGAYMLLNVKTSDH